MSANLRRRNAPPRLFASDATSAISGGELTFTTGGPPSVKILGKAAGYDKIVFNALIDPEGSETTFHYAWSTNAVYGHAHRPSPYDHTSSDVVIPGP